MPAKKTSAPKAYQVPAVKRAFAILDTLNDSATGHTVQEISRVHKLPYSTAFYLLETMLQCSYVQRDEDSKRYTLGYKLLAFCESPAARRNLNLRALASPLMEELSSVSGLTCHLATLEGNEAVYIEKAEPSGYIRLNTWVGKRNVLHSTAVGKALLMNMSDASVRSLLGGATLARKSDRTITDIGLLLQDLKNARERGYAIDDGEDEPAGCCIAAPIFDANGAAVAALGLSGLVGQMDTRRRDSFGKLVRSYARQISARLGFVDPRDVAAGA